MSTRLLSVAAISALMLLSACDDTTDDIGISLTDNSDQLAVSSSVFQAFSRSVAVDSVVAKSSRGYLGRIKDPETDAYVTGDFMTQFNCMEGFTILAKDSIAHHDENGEVIADSCEIRLFYNSYYGDSLATMKLTLYELDHPMQEDVTYYSDYSPLDDGNVRLDGVHEQKTYTLLNYSDENRGKDNDYINNICIRLNNPYTAKDGRTYNNYGSYVMHSFYEHPEYFKNANIFRRHVMPGFFFKVTGGMGSMAYVTSPQINIYFSHYKNKNNTDSISKSYTLLSGTEEVLQTTTVTNDHSAIASLVSDETCTYIKSPSGIFTEITLPVDNILAGHDNDTINTAKMVLHRLNNEQWNTYNLPAPQTLLLVEADSVSSFFENSKVANYKQSFLASYSTVNNTYTFSNIGALISAMNAAKKAGLKKDPSWVAAHPNWNKVLLIPVTTTTTSYSNTTILSDVRNDMSLTSTRLQGGSSTPIEIHVIYSKFE
ncbi:MAG: DUF4270 domain-containing protein [Prevotella sp.]|nr:DUF4270 domain-containing protein [Prevotella sp.]